MSYGTCLLVSAGMSDFRCHFLCWLDDDKMLCLNRCGKQITVSQYFTQEAAFKAFGHIKLEVV